MKRTICFFVSFITLCSCVSINHIHYDRFVKEGYIQGFRADSVYYFRNEPFMSHNMIGLTDSVPLENPYHTLWYQIVFNSKLKMDELRGSYVRITPISKKRLKFDLVGADEQLIQSRKRRIKQYRGF